MILGTQEWGLVEGIPSIGVLRFGWRVLVHAQQYVGFVEEGPVPVGLVCMSVEQAETRHLGCIVASSPL